LAVASPHGPTVVEMAVEHATEVYRPADRRECLHDDAEAAVPTVGVDPAETRRLCRGVSERRSVEELFKPQAFQVAADGLEPWAIEPRELLRDRGGKDIVVATFFTSARFCDRSNSVQLWERSAIGSATGPWIPS
jgi:hypothetical protein